MKKFEYEFVVNYQGNLIFRFKGRNWFLVQEIKADGNIYTPVLKRIR